MDGKEREESNVDDAHERSTEKCVSELKYILDTKISNLEARN